MVHISSGLQGVALGPSGQGFRGIGGSYHNMPKATFYLLKGGYKV